MPRTELQTALLALSAAAHAATRAALREGVTMEDAAPLRDLAAKADRICDFGLPREAALGQVAAE